MTIITTAEELDALPESAVIMSAGRGVYQASDHDLVDPPLRLWSVIGGQGGVTTRVLLGYAPFPFTVLYNPAAPRVTDEMVERAALVLRRCDGWCPCANAGCEDELAHIVRAALEAALGVEL